MRAAVADAPGPPEVLRVRDLPSRTRAPAGRSCGCAFGVNRSEIFTRQGHSGDAVGFPRVLGIECVREVEETVDEGAAPRGTNRRRREANRAVGKVIGIP